MKCELASSMGIRVWESNTAIILEAALILMCIGLGLLEMDLRARSNAGGEKCEQGEDEGEHGHL